MQDRVEGNRGGNPHAGCAAYGGVFLLGDNEGDAMKSNWEHFKNFYEAWKPWLKFPCVRIVRADDIEALKNQPHTVALYEPKDNSINILFEHRNNKAIFLHECGHWINVVIYAALEILWEFIWWGCSVRNLFVKVKK